MQAITSEGPLRDAWNCFDRLSPPAECQRRAALMGDAIERLAGFRSDLARLRREAASRPCRGLRAGLTDRAYAAEAASRILLAETLRLTNDLRDSGLLHASLADFARTLGNQEKDLAELADETIRSAQAASTGIPDEAFATVRASFQQRRIRVRCDADAGVLVLRGPSLLDGEPQEIRVRLAERAGDQGRIGLEQFFGADESAGVALEQRSPAPSDCHHRGGTSGSAAADIDAYSVVLGGLVACRETMYAEARKISEHGYRATSASEPVTVGIVVAVVAYAVSAIAGVIAGLTTGTTSAISTAIAGVAFLGLIGSLIFLAVVWP